MFFKEANVDHHVELILTPLFRELTQEEETGQSTYKFKGGFLNRNWQYFKARSPSCLKKCF
jgi:hypothetical protein